jgi:UDP-galactopyranose mutase
MVLAASAQRRSVRVNDGDDQSLPLLSYDDTTCTTTTTTTTGTNKMNKSPSVESKKKMGFAAAMVCVMGMAVYVTATPSSSLKSGATPTPFTSNFQARGGALTDYHDLCIVGAGLSGSVIAERYATQRNQTSLIIERREHIAGNCFDYIDEETGIRVSKYGAHLFHTYYDRVWEYVQKFSKWTPYEHEVIGLVEGKYVPIPVNIHTVNTLFNQKITNSEQMDKWLDQEQVKYPGEPQNSEEMAMSRVGKRLYELIFHPYTIKQWAKEPRDLGPEVTARIPVRNNFDGRYFADPHQALPSNGYTAIFEKMLGHPLISVHLNTDFFEVRPTLNCGKLYYTGPVDRYFADSGLKKLEYRSLDFERRVIKNIKGHYQPKGVVNHPSADDNFTRIVEFKHFLNQTSDHTILFLEHSKDHGEPYYPVPNPENKELFLKYKEMSDQEVGVSFVGRLANYKYFNMDQTIENALQLFDDDTSTKDLIVHIGCNDGNGEWINEWKTSFSNIYVYSTCQGNKIEGAIELHFNNIDNVFMEHMKRKDITFAASNVFLQGRTSINLNTALASMNKIQAEKTFVDFASLPFWSCSASKCNRNLDVTQAEFFATQEAIQRFISS